VNVTPAYLFIILQTCVFSLAVTLWLAADWKLTEAQKPSLSQSLQDLFVSMTYDSSKDRPGFDSILQVKST